ncbi:MAG: 6-hydroxymethylpterin diphosphokinase MptE-like protein [Promethearchaeota archaeon]
MDMNKAVFSFPKASFWYQKILDTFGFDSAQDLHARDVLYDFLKGRDPTSLIEAFSQTLTIKQPLFFGAGPNLREHITYLDSHLHLSWDKYTIVAADGAAVALADHNITPNLIVSDLDGLTFSQVQKFLEQGVFLLIHAHGDNVDKLHEYQLLLQTFPNIIGTTQTPPRDPIINAGGFTDGDRGVYFCHHLTPPTVEFWLFGYEYGELIGHDSKPDFIQHQPMTSIKKQKLRFCQALLEDLTASYQRTIHYFHESNKELFPIL